MDQARSLSLNIRTIVECEVTQRGIELGAELLDVVSTPRLELESGMEQELHVRGKAWDLASIDGALGKDLGVKCVRHRA